MERGSGIFEFVAQFYPLMTWIVALGAEASWYRKFLITDKEFDEKRIVSASDFVALFA